MINQVLIDLNLPALQDDLFELDGNEYRQVAKVLKKIKAMTWDEIYHDHGLKWEVVKNTTGIYTIRLSRGSRALVARDGNAMRFIAIRSDHDNAYGKK
ncbi:MAG: hypothetical protein WCP34_14660 [Pseudomonadota bacterium]